MQVGIETNSKYDWNPQALQITPHPQWIKDMLISLRNEWDRACLSPLFQQTATGNLPPLRCWQSFLANSFIIVESFPKYMGLSLFKTTYGQKLGDSSIRGWFLENLRVEERHAQWYIDWMQGIGIEPQEVFAMKPCQEMQALHEHLLLQCQTGTLAEGVAAAHWAIEGVTGVWTKLVEKPFRKYADYGAHIDKNSMLWLKAHARYDDHHPEEALEILKYSVDVNTDERERVVAAARKSLELFGLAMRSFYSE